jgi:S-adenosyl methyltransferase
MTMQPGWVPTGIDTSKANIARVYDWPLGGDHNLPAFETTYKSKVAAQGRARTSAEIARFFDGFTLIEPGLVWVPQWRPGHPQDVPADPEKYWFLAGVGAT